MLYQMAFPDVEFVVCPINCLGITKENWYKSERGINRVLGELEGADNYVVVPATDLVWVQEAGE